MVRFLSFCVLLVCGSARADVYLLWVGSWQRGPAHSHTFSVLDRIDTHGNRTRLVISWGPAGEWRLLSGPVPGRNYTLPETLEHARRAGATVAWSGPYLVDHAFWERFRWRVEELNRGVYLYAALDARYLPGATNCIGAVIGVSGTRPPTGLKYGHRATPVVVEYLMGRQP